MHFDLNQIIQTVGYLGLFIIVFAESGLFFGFFLPGDSLLVTAGLLATQGIFKIYFLIPLLVFAAISGDSAGYWIGKKFGPRIFNKENSLFFDKKHIETAGDFYKEHGKKTIILARFIPYVRTFAPIVAGIGEMDYKEFLTYNVVGGTIWATLMLVIGYFLGKTIPNVDHYIIPIIVIIVILSFVPTAYEHRKKIIHQSNRILRKAFK